MFKREEDYKVNKQSRLVVFLILLVGIILISTVKVEASNHIQYGLSNYDKLYINELGVMALSKGDVVRIDGEHNGHYYTMTKSGNIFFIPMHRIKLIDSYDPLYNQDFIDKKIERQSKVTSLAGFAYMQLGKPYVWAANGPSAYDCSGFTTASYNSIGISIPRTSKTQIDVGKRVGPNDLQIGDLVFFRSPSSPVISHVGMYMGEGEFIHASSSGKKVMISGLTQGYYRQNIVGARRIIE